MKSTVETMSSNNPIKNKNRSVSITTRKETHKNGSKNKTNVELKFAISFLNMNRDRVVNTGTNHGRNNRSLKIITVWDVIPCSLVDRYRYFEGTYCLQLPS
jgi:hypothetical protein